MNNERDFNRSPKGLRAKDYQQSEFEKAFRKPDKSDFTDEEMYLRAYVVWFSHKEGALWALKWVRDYHCSNGYVAHAVIDEIENIENIS